MPANPDVQASLLAAIVLAACAADAPPLPAGVASGLCRENKNVAANRYGLLAALLLAAHGAGAPPLPHNRSASTHHAVPFWRV